MLAVSDVAIKEIDGPHKCSGNQCFEIPTLPTLMFRLQRYNKVI